MTTQHTHHDHSDVDATVVEHPPAPETTDGPIASETTQPAGEEVEVSIPSSELATPAEVQEEVHDEPPVVQEEEPSQTEASVDETQVQDSMETHSSKPAPVEPASHNVEENENVAFSYARVVPLPLIDTKNEEIRPFTDFIEQFRQAEAARLQATLRESQIEALSLLASAEVADLAAPVLPSNSEEEVPSETPGFSLETAEEISSVAAIDVAAQTQDGSDSPIVAAPSSIEDKASEAAPIIAQTPEEPVTEASAEISAPAPVVERPVSPLLRSSSRLRPSRHTSKQHHREEIREEARQATEAETLPQVVPTEAQAQPAPIESTQTPVESPAEPEPPRPARRYRFDRPAATNGTTHTTPQRVEESRTATSPLTRTDSGVSEQTQETRPAASVAQPAEQQGQKQPVVQEPPTTGNVVVSAPAASTEPGRRRGQKEQPPAASTTPVVEATPPAPEPPAQQEEIAPEDLPPLEYADLQKASSRRRRRHRSGTSNGTSAAAATSIPAPQPTPPSAAPATPPRTPAASTTYSIVSGYTVNQMNQGNDVTGPFMAPDPSPARGSVFTREVRSSRGEVVPRSTSTPAYPSPVRESSVTSASLTHFANIVSQAIQTQTDAMVAELRRVTQAPTNVSVSLPPFPSTERVGVFVDVANLLYSARTLRIAVDFGKLLDFLRGNRRLVRAQAYCPTSPQAGEEQMFLQAVKGLGYRITTKNYKTFSSGAKKADLDLDLCMDVVRLVDGRAVDCIVLVSGDSDFMPMLDYCSDHGVRVEVAAFDEAMSATLRQSCDLFINLSMLEEIRA